MTVGEIVLLCLALASLALLVVVLLYYKYSRKFTRERFAFRVFLLISSLSASLILILISSKTTVAMTIAVVAKLFGVDVTEFEPSLSDKLLAVGLILALIYLALKLHRDWPGEISVREYQARLVGLNPGLIGGVVAAVGEISGKVPLEVYSGSISSQQGSDISFSPNENKAWHHWAVRILQLKMNQLHIDELRDWYADQRLFIGGYGPNRSTLAILCLDEIPSGDVIQKSIDFVGSKLGIPLVLLSP